ncbi:hypothetical protein CI610_01404 [invertebrate metagenome]|uniref:Peptidase C45 hydrolase domain-containing protein n=1 Tax=invertebrate metagenome TaxID=1711999 RepID=A0A2H9T8Q2_9ZZZZ
MSTIKTVLSLTALVCSVGVNACTSVGFSGTSAEGGGTLIAKNRDAPFTGYQRLSVFHPKGKYAYVALMYGNDEHTKVYPYISAGTNEAGLTVVVNDASSNLPDDPNAVETRIMRKILMQYDSVAAVQKDAAKLFGQNDPALYLLSDGKQVANFQAGYDNRYAGRVTAHGTVWNTNYYHLKSVLVDNKMIPDSTKARTAVLKEWLKIKPESVSVGDITRLLASHYNGPLKSISRQYTVAKYMVRHEPDRAPVLMVKETIPTQPYNAYSITLDEKFFQSTHEGPLDNDGRFGLLGSLNRTKTNS